MRQTPFLAQQLHPKNKILQFGYLPEASAIVRCFFDLSVEVQRDTGFSSLRLRRLTIQD